MVSVPERVNRFLMERGASICDRCIQQSLKLSVSNQVQQITSALGTTRDFKREKGLCSICKNQKMVTQSVRSKAHHQHRAE